MLNPFKEKAQSIEKCFRSLEDIYLEPYKKEEASAFTKARVILANAIELYGIRLLHGMHRFSADNNIRRTLALLRRIHQLQQKSLAYLKPSNETPLETAVIIEFLTTSLAATMAQTELNRYIKAGLDFALIEDFDHLYRFSTLLNAETGEDASRILAGSMEIMPGRPTISSHRFPFDDVKKFIPANESILQSKLNALIITATEEYAMYFYIHSQSLHNSIIGRKLFCEIGMAEEQHVTQHGSLLDSSATLAEQLTLWEYAATYSYYCLAKSESQKRIRNLYESIYLQQCQMSMTAAKVLKAYENRDYSEFLDNGDFPQPLIFEDNVANNREYIRSVLKSDIERTGVLEEYADVNQLPQGFQFFDYNDMMTNNGSASHAVAESYIAEFGTDYRYQESPHPIKQLRDRKKDNITVGRV